MGPTEFELAGRIDVHHDVVVPPGAEHRLDDVFDDGGLQFRLLRLAVPLRTVLRREHDGPDRGRAAFVVFDGDLALRIGTEMGDRLGLADFGLPGDQLVREVDGKRHQRFGLATREAEHQPLVSGALLGRIATRLVSIHALVDVGALLVERDENCTAASVESLRRIVVADLLGGLSDDLGDLHVAVAGHFAGDHRHAGRDHRFAGDSTVRVDGDHGVEHGIRDLVRELVGMAHRNGFGGEEVRAVGHGFSLIR